MADVIATYAVHAGTTTTVELEDVTDPDLVALYLIEDAAELVDAAVCHQCADTVIDPAVGDLTGFTVDGVSYGREYYGDKPTGHWVPIGGQQ